MTNRTFGLQQAAKITLAAWIVEDCYLAGAYSVCLENWMYRVVGYFFEKSKTIVSLQWLNQAWMFFVSM